MNTHNHQRLFFALALNSPANQLAFTQLCQLIPRLPGKGHQVPEPNLHLTLAFLGAVNQQQKAQLINLADKITAPSFTFSAHALQYRKRNRMIWLGGETTPAPLTQLVSDLKQAALQAGLEQETRRYTPHITLKKHVRQQPEGLPENVNFSFHFEHFGLYISEPVNTAQGAGVHYRCLRQWPLTQPNSNQDPE